MRDDAMKQRQATEPTGQAMQRGATREGGAMPLEDEGAEVIGHMPPMTPEPMAPDATAEKNRQPEAEGQAQRGAPMQPEQAM